MNKISIIIPIYNVEAYVTQCIKSIINQTYQNLEIILVNDGSQDTSGQICDKFSEKDPRIRVIHTQNNGLSEARNEGLRNSSGDYIMFVDGDDFITQNAIYDIVQLINEKEEDIDIVTGKMINYYSHQKQITETFELNCEKFHDKAGTEILLYYFEEIPVSMWSACRSIYRRKLLIDNNLFFTKGITSEDLDLVPYIYMKANKVIPYEIPFYYYRQLRPNSIINTVSTKKFYDIVFIIEKHISQLQRNHYSMRFKKAFIMQLANIYACYVALLGAIPKSERKDVLIEMKRVKHILIYTKGFRNKCIAIFARMVGFNITFTLYGALKKIRNYKFKYSI